MDSKKNKLPGNEKCCKGICKWNGEIDSIIQSIQNRFNLLNCKISNNEFSCHLEKLFEGKKTNKSEVIYPTDLNNVKDFKGLYVFIDKQKPVYAGISRSVFRRLQQHLKGKEKNQASLAYRMAKLRNKRNMNITKFDKNKLLPYLEKEQEKLLKMNLLLEKIECDYELYMFEVYAAFIWKCKHNAFRTH